MGHARRWELVAGISCFSGSGMGDVPRQTSAKWRILLVHLKSTHRIDGIVCALVE